MSFERLHSSVQFHIVNSLGWSSLRPLQQNAVDPILAGSDVLLIAPTAGGKTEAAILPILSRMLTEDWHGLSVLYVCPIKALLNNLQERLHQYASLVGRRCELWHGDVGQGARRQIRENPPDILLTTPESLEAQLVSRRSSPGALFPDVRVAIVDEVHAFAGDDRGWHLLAVLSRLQLLAGRRIQRIGLSATIGNPERIIGWLSSGRPPGVIVNPGGASAREADVQIDYVGTLANAAQVMAQLHRGYKRLAFCDSRAASEELARCVTEHGVQAFVSHSSLSKESRQAAEQAFAEGRDCVIVATSTLELGIDVGDLDYVIQIDAPRTVASFLQRMGRTGRRSGTKPNCLFLATWNESLVEAAAIVELWEKGFVEPVDPPGQPLHILAQQIMAQALQREGVTRADWSIGLEPFLAASALSVQDGEALLNHMVAAELLHEEDGVLWFGRRGEEAYGRQNFMDLLSVFATEELFEVRHGRQQIGSVHRLTFAGGEKGTDERRALLLGGRTWEVRDIDWPRGVVQVTPGAGPAKSRWKGAAPPRSFELCQAMERVLAHDGDSSRWSRRAVTAMAEARREHWFVDGESTCLLPQGKGAFEWWTFGGLVVNLQLAAAIEAAVPTKAQASNLFIRIEGIAATHAIEATIRSLTVKPPQFHPGALKEVAEGLKFSICLPPGLVARLLKARYAGTSALQRIVARPLRVLTE